MGKRDRLSDAAIQAALSELPGWSVVDEKLRREYKFPDFVHAFGFMATAATAIEAMNHHPEWSNIWNRVTIDLTTHDAGGITAMDIELAKKLESFAKKLSS